MPIYQIQAPDGKTYQIEGPAGATQTDVIKAILAQNPEAGSPPTPKPQGGFFSSAKESIGTLLGGKKAAEFVYGSPEKQAAAQAEMSKPSEYASTTPMDVIAGEGKFSDMLAQGAGGSLGALVVPYLGAVGTNLMKGPGAAKAVGAGLLGAQYLVSNLERQAGERTAATAKGQAPEEISAGKAAVAAAGSTGLDLLGMKFFAPVFKMFPVMGKLLGAEGDDAAKLAANQLVDAYKNKTLSYTGGIAKGIGMGMAFEIPQEVAQQALERWQAGLSLTDKDAQVEYFNAGAMASILGGGMGGAKGGIETLQNRRQAEAAVDPNAPVDSNAPTAPNAPVDPNAPTAPADAVSTVITPEAREAHILVGRNILADNPGISEMELAEAMTKKIGAPPLVDMVQEAIKRGPLKSEVNILAEENNAEVLNANSGNGLGAGATSAETLVPQADTRGLAVDTVNAERVDNSGIPAGSADVGTGAEQPTLEPAEVKPAEVKPAEVKPAEVKPVTRKINKQKLETKNVTSDTAPVTDIETAWAQLDKASKKATQARKAYEKADNALAVDDPKLKIAREKMQVAEKEHDAALQAAADIAKGTTKKEPAVTVPTSDVLQEANKKIDDALIKKRKEIKSIEPEEGDTNVQRQVKAEIKKLKTIDDQRDYQNAVDFIVAEGDANLIKIAGIPQADIEKAKRRNKARSEEDLTGASIKAIADPATPEVEYNRHIDYVMTKEGGEAKLRDIGMKDKEIVASKKRIEIQKGKDAGIKGTTTRESMMIRYENLLDRKSTLIRELADAKEDGYEEKIRTTENRLEINTDDIKKLRAYAHSQGVRLSGKRVAPQHIVAPRSPARGEGEGMTVAEVERVRDLLQEKWKAAPEINVVENPDDLPTRLREQLEFYDSEDAPGIYDPVTESVYLIAENTKSIEGAIDTILHEVVGHHGLRTVLGDKYKGMMATAYFNPAVKAYADKYMADNKGVSKEIAVEEALAELSVSPESKKGALGRFFDRIISNIRAFLRDISNNTIASSFSDAEIRNLINNSRNYIETGKGAASTVTGDMTPVLAPAKQTKTAPPLESKTTDELVAELRNKNIIKNTKPFKKGVIEAVKRTTTTWSGYESLVNNLQNDRVVLKTLENQIRAAGKLRSSGSSSNDLFALITNSSGVAFHNITAYIKNQADTIQESILAYAKKQKISVEDALNKLHLYVMAMHEPERRLVKWLRTVPLNDKLVAFEGAYHKAADLRELIFRRLGEEKVLTAAEAKALRSMADNLANNYSDKYGRAEGKDPKVAAEIDIKDARYNVIGSYLQSDLVRMQKEFKAEIEKNPVLDTMLKAMRELNENTIMLDKKSNYWSRQVDNYRLFYGFKDYVPFKLENKVSPKDNIYSQSGGHESALVKIQLGFEGTTEDSNHPILQMVADGYSAGLRSGRVGITQAIKNLMGYENKIKGTVDEKNQLIKGSLLARIPFNDRRAYLESDEGKALRSPSNIFHLTEDGFIEVYHIKDPKVQESIRRSVTKAHPFVEFFNKFTSAVGQQHTRYNPSFAPMDFTRNTFSYAGVLGSEKGLKVAKNYMASMATNVASGGLNKAWTVSKLYHEGGIENLNKIKAMGAKDGFVSDLYEYLELGGRVSYVQSLSIQTERDELVKDIGRSGLARGLEHINKWVDLWNNMFEFTSRAAAYSVVKNDLIAKHMAKGMSKSDATTEAKREAVAYVKNLANFEQIGKYGRLAGALFMFFRPAATGAVRAIDALMPGFQDTDAMVKLLPEAIRNDKEAVAEFRKDHQEKKKLARHMMGIMTGAGIAIYFMAYTMAGDDDEGRNKVGVDDMARWTRYMRLPIPGSDMFIQVPWGFGLGAFSAFGAQISAIAAGETKWSEAAVNIGSIAMDSFLPIPASRISPIDNFPAFMVDSIFPSLGRPLIEYAMNTDSLGRQIYNSRQTRFGDAYSGGDEIPEIYKTVARYIANATASSEMFPAQDISPNTLYFFANNYFDGISRVMLSAPYSLGLVATGEKGFDPKHDFVFLNSYVGKAANFDGKQFASVQRKITEMEKRINMYKTNPDVYSEYLDANPMDEMIVKIYNKQIAAVNKLTAEAKKINTNTELSVKERKELLEDNKKNINMVKRNVIDMFADYDVKP